MEQFEILNLPIYRFRHKGRREGKIVAEQHIAFDAVGTNRGAVPGGGTGVGYSTVGRRGAKRRAEGCSL